MSDPLKLRAEDRDDIALVAACLQDGLTQLSDMAFLPDERRFVFVANRFCWENCGEARTDCQSFERVRCGVTFEDVGAAQVRGIDQDDGSRLLSLLTIEAGEGDVKLVFAGGGEIRLQIGRLFCHLSDMGEPWPTQWRPDHPVVDAE